MHRLGDRETAGRFAPGMVGGGGGDIGFGGADAGHDELAGQLGQGNRFLGQNGDAGLVHLGETAGDEDALLDLAILVDVDDAGAKGDFEGTYFIAVCIAWAMTRRRAASRLV